MSILMKFDAATGASLPTAAPSAGINCRSRGSSRGRCDALQASRNWLAAKEKPYLLPLRLKRSAATDTGSTTGFVVDGVTGISLAVRRVAEGFC